jgi:hypothetical protein
MTAAFWEPEVEQKIALGEGRTMRDYDETQERLAAQRTGSTVTRISGVPLQGRTIKGWFPIHPCLCVQDSPENPCPCNNLDDVLVWLPSNVSPQRSGQQHEGEEVFSYEVPANVRILVETQIPMTAGDLQHMKKLTVRGRGKAVSLLQARSRARVSVGELLVGAFALGWAIGEKVDEETGASDAISDWLAEEIPWPF